MISWDEIERLKREASDLSRYGTHMAVVFSLVFSLAVVVILSKKHLINYLWADVAAFAVPIPIALFFKNRIVVLGAFVYIGALILALAAAVLFGV